MELQKQEQRQHSLILRGFQTGDEGHARRKFKEICLFLNVGSIELSNLSKIGTTRLFRAKILNREKRLLLLRSAINLKTSEQYRSAYIQKDLTYRQRQQLFCRRATSGRSGGQPFHDSRDVVDSVGAGGVASSGAAALAPRCDVVGHGYYPCNRGGVQRGRGVSAAVCGAGSAASTVTRGSRLGRGHGRGVC